MVISNVVELLCLTGRNTLNTYSVYVIWKYLHRISCGQNNKTTGNRIASTLFYDLFPKSMQIRQITFPVLKNYATRAFSMHNGQISWQLITFLFIITAYIFKKCFEKYIFHLIAIWLSPNDNLLSRG